MDRLPLVLVVMAVRLQQLASLDDLPAAAEPLFTASPGLFNSRAWWRTVLAYGMPAQTSPCFLLIWSGDTPVALFPMRRPQAGGGLDSLTTPYSSLFAPLLAPDLSPATQVSIFAAFARFCRRHATTRLDALPDDWPGLSACRDGAQAGGLAVVPFAHFGNWYEDVRGLDWGGYLARRPGALRETIRRKLRRAEKRADTSFSIVTGGAALESGVAAYEHVYARSWKEPEPFPHFNAALMRETAAAGLLRLGLWQVGGTPVSAQFWVVEQGTATVLKLAHDEAFHAESPGTVLTALMLRTLLESEHVAAIDFGRGDDDYKKDWTSQRRQRIGLVLVNPRRPAGLIFLARHRLGRIYMSLRGAERRSNPGHECSTMTQPVSPLRSSQ